MLLILRHH